MTSPADARQPRRFGPYTALRPLGAGSYGTVYVAEQTEPVQRRVALKVLRAEPGTAARERLAAETWALTRLEHPNVAAILDAGVDGEHAWVAMELVRGRPLPDYCDSRSIGARERLELFTQICAGVEHAHQRGVIHCDLKPANVLVTEREGRPVVKLVDFGIARPTEATADAGGASAAPPTALTLPYASPERIVAGPDAADTRGDVWSLGVMLYELVCGERPFDLTGCTPLDAALRIRRSELRPTSTASGTAAARRGRRGPELDWIVHRALEKDPEDRYQTVGELADDVCRYLRDEPVLARPTTPAYVLRKFVRRHRGSLAAGVVVVLAAVLAIVIALRATADARAARRSARAEQRAARDAAQLVEKRLAEYRIIEVEPRLRQARTSMAALVPVVSERVTAVERWLAEEVEPLRRMVPALDAALQALRARAEERQPAEVPELRAALEACRLELEELEGPQLVAALGDELRATWRRHIEARLAGIERRIERSVVCRLADDTEQLLHDALTEATRELEEFLAPGTGDVARIRRHLDWARRVEELSLGRHADRWQRARREIAGADRYGGLDLAPQLGLVPLGTDPRSGLHEFYHLRSAADAAQIPARDASGALELAPRAGIVFVLLPAGAFAMGAQRRDPGARNHDPAALRPFEQPVHDVELAPFLLAKHELTESQWVALHGLDGARVHLPGHPMPGGQVSTWRHPAADESWYRVRDVLSSCALRLPTEAQWEYACRAGSSAPFSCEGALDAFANLADRSVAGMMPPGRLDPTLDDGFVGPAPVGAFAPNAFGLFDVHGNVSEWVAEGRGDYRFAPRKGDGLRRFLIAGTRVARGGAFSHRPIHARASYRYTEPPTNGQRWVGVRPARAIER